MMNDRFVIGEARFWAKTLVEETSESVDTRLRTMYRTSLGRVPTKREMERMGALASRLGALHGVPEEQLLESVPVWRDVAHTIFNLKEFVYIQ